MIDKAIFNLNEIKFDRELEIILSSNNNYNVKSFFKGVGKTVSRDISDKYSLR